VRFYFKDGSQMDPGGNFYTHSSYPNYSPDCCTSYWTFEDEALATAKIMGAYEMIPRRTGTLATAWCSGSGKRIRLLPNGRGACQDGWPHRARK
jgi:hypothetical protein